MKILCKSSFVIRNGNIHFEKGKYYPFFVEKHEETGLDVYYVGSEKHPMLKRTIEENFDFISHVRDKKIDLILNK